MKIEKYLCDRCGREIFISPNKPSITLHKGDTELDLCGIYLYNGSVIIVSDPYEMQRLEKIIKEVNDFVTRHDIQDAYYSMLTDKLIEEGW